MQEFFMVVEYFIYGLLALAMGLGVYSAHKFSRGALGILFSSFAYSTFFIAAYFVFMRLSEDGGHYSNVSLHVWAHVIVYFSMISLIWGAWHTKKVAEQSSQDSVSHHNIWKHSFYWLLMALMFLSLSISVSLEEEFAQFLSGSIVDILGLHHFSVFFLAAVAAWYLQSLKGDWGLLEKSLSFLIGFLSLIGLQHFWETLTESWRVIELDAMVVEGIEMLIIIPAILLLCLGQWNIIRFLRQ